MGIIKRMMREKAVYWAPLPKDGYGEQQFAAPIEIKCRWEGGMKRFRTPTNEEKTSTAQVYVDRDLEENGKLWLGLLANVPSQDPLQIPKAFIIQAFTNKPDLKVRERLRTAFL